jgi:two-component system chemotaxis response regulator CheB
MGDDGAAGLLKLLRAGGRTLAQDETTAAVYGMPKAARDCGAAEEFVPLQQLAARLTELL